MPADSRRRLRRGATATVERNTPRATSARPGPTATAPGPGPAATSSGPGPTATAPGPAATSPGPGPATTSPGPGPRDLTRPRPGCDFARTWTHLCGPGTGFTPCPPARASRLTVNRAPIVCWTEGGLWDADYTRGGALPGSQNRLGARHCCLTPSLFTGNVSLLVACVERRQMALRRSRLQMLGILCGLVILAGPALPSRADRSRRAG